MCNNANSSFRIGAAIEFYVEAVNEGMFARQMSCQKTATPGTLHANPNGRIIIYGNDYTRIRNSGFNYTESTAVNKVFYYDVIIRCKDIQFLQITPIFKRVVS